MNLEVLFEKSWKGQRLLIRCRSWLAEINYICAVHRLIQRWRGAPNYVKCLNLSFEKWEISFACDVFLSSLMDLKRMTGWVLLSTGSKTTFIYHVKMKWQQCRDHRIADVFLKQAKEPKSSQLHSIKWSKCVFLWANR